MLLSNFPFMCDIMQINIPLWLKSHLSEKNVSHCSRKHFLLVSFSSNFIFLRITFFPWRWNLMGGRCVMLGRPEPTGEKATLRHWEDEAGSTASPKQWAPQSSRPPSFFSPTDTNGLLRANLHTNSETKEISTYPWIFSKRVRSRKFVWGSWSRLMFAFWKIA